MIAVSSAVSTIAEDFLFLDPVLRGYARGFSRSTSVRQRAFTAPLRQSFQGTFDLRILGHLAVRRHPNLLQVEDLLSDHIPNVQAHQGTPLDLTHRRLPPVLPWGSSC